MSMKRIYKPNNVWVITVNGFNPDPDAEPLRIVYTTKYAAIETVKSVAAKLEEKYPDLTWFADMDDAKGKTGFCFEAYEYPRIGVRATRVMFTDNRMLTEEIIRRQTTGEY